MSTAVAAVSALTPQLNRLFLNNPEIAIRDEQLESSADILHAHSQALYEVSAAAARDRTGARNNVDRLTRITNEHGEAYRPQVEAAEAELERLKRRAVDTSNQSSDAIKVENALRRHVNDERRYLSRQFKPDDIIKLVPNPKPVKGDPYKLIADIDARTAEIEALPQPADAVEAAAIAEVDKYAAMPLGRVTFGKEPGFLWPLVGVPAAADRDHPGVIPTAPDPRPALARLYHDELVADIKQQVAGHYRGKPAGMTAADKRAAIKKLRAERLAADRVRCAQIWADFDAGKTSTLAFPADADVRAILMVDGPEPNRTSD